MPSTPSSTSEASDSDSDSESSNATEGNPAAGFKYALNTRVFCFHGPLMYESRLVQTEMRNGKPFYLVHYVGWNKNWDEWADETRVREFTEKNVKEAKRLKEQAKATGKGQKRKSANMSMSDKDGPSASEDAKPTGGKEAKTTITGSAEKIKEEVKEKAVSKDSADEKPPKGLTRGRKRQRSSLSLWRERQREQVHLNETIRLKIPSRLKEILLEDWKKISHDNMVVKLPPRKSIKVILEEYATHRVDQELLRLESHESGRQLPGDAIEDGRPVAFRANSPQLNATVYCEVVNQMKLFFNTVLASKLLYSSSLERDQLEDLEKMVADLTKSSSNLLPKGRVKEEEDEENQTEAGMLEKLRSRKISTANGTKKEVKVEVKEETSTAIKYLLTRPSDDLTTVYGFTHLLRLFTIIPWLLSYNSPPPEGITLSVACFQDLLHYLNQKRSDLYSTVEYQSEAVKVKTEESTYKQPGPVSISKWIK